MGIMDVLEELNGPEYEEAPPVQPEVVPVPEPALVVVQEDALEEAPPAPKRQMRPEWVMAIVAGLAAVMLLAVVLLCLPYIQTEQPQEDPEALPQRHEVNHATQPLEILPEATEETVPPFTTSPPDRNLLDQYDFQYNRHNYLLLQNLPSYAGVDVSAYQGDIDWEAVKASGIDFAIIRLGYRGYESGKLVKDERAEDNLTGALDAGLQVGAYFFSQALNTKEVDEEIAFMLEILGERYLAMPIVLDWEIPAATARTRNMDARTLTDLQLHFCESMEERGYQPMIYFNWHQSEHLYYLPELEDYPFWLALYQDRMTYPWKVEMWQYTASGTVPGINGPVDLNVYMPD